MRDNYYLYQNIQIIVKNNGKMAKTSSKNIVFDG